MVSEKWSNATLKLERRYLRAEITACASSGSGSSTTLRSCPGGTIHKASILATRGVDSDRTQTGCLTSFEHYRMRQKISQPLALFAHRSGVMRLQPFCHRNGCCCCCGYPVAVLPEHRLEGSPPEYDNSGRASAVMGITLDTL
jgi:hypothetical protein